MKKLIFICLMLILGISCQDPELKMSSVNKGDGLNIKPLNCPNPQQTEPKLFDMNGSYTPPTLEYGENVTITWQSNDLFRPNDLVGTYALVIKVKNLSTKTILYYTAGYGYGTLTAGSSKTYNWNGTCDECYGPTCPAAVNGSFYFTINTASGSNYTCSADMEVKLYTTDGYNIPTLSTAQIITYHFTNPDC